MAYNPNNPNGQAPMTSSAPVVLAVDHSTIPVNVVDSLTNNGYQALTVYAAATINAGVIATSKKLMGWYVYNNFTAPIKLCFYDIASPSVPTGSETPKFVIVVPAQSGANVSFPSGIQFTNNIAYATSSTLPLGTPASLSGLTSANNFIFTLFYK